MFLLTVADSGCSPYCFLTISIPLSFRFLWLFIFIVYVFTHRGRQWLFPVLLPNHLHTVEFPFSVRASGHPTIHGVCRVLVHSVAEVQHLYQLLIDLRYMLGFTNLSVPHNYNTVTWGENVGFSSVPLTLKALK